MLHPAHVSSTEATQTPRAENYGTRVQVHQMYNCTITILLLRANKTSYTLGNRYQGSTNVPKNSEAT